MNMTYLLLQEDVKGQDGEEAKIGRHCLPVTIL